MLGCPKKSVAGTGPVAGTTTIHRGSVNEGNGSGCTHDHVAGNGRTTADSSPSGLPLKLAALYARVSSDQQEKEQTIASQVDALQQAAHERGYHLAPELLFTDEGYTGARLDRPALDRLRDLAAEGAFEAVFVYTPDRLARHYAYQVLLLEEFERVGCTVTFLNHAFSNSPEEQMLLQMQGVFAEYERAQIQERTRRGRLFAARQGRVNWGQNATYGYRYLRKTETTPQQLVVEESEAAVVRQIYQSEAPHRTPDSHPQPQPTRVGTEHRHRDLAQPDLHGPDPLQSHPGGRCTAAQNGTESQRPAARQWTGSGAASERGMDSGTSTRRHRPGVVEPSARAVSTQSRAGYPEQHQARLPTTEPAGMRPVWSAAGGHLVEAGAGSLRVLGAVSASRCLEL
jgi:DNA invertase Pin-like site-specific DNA recombinase